MNSVVEKPEEMLIENIITLARNENTRISASTNVELNKKIFFVYESSLKPLKRLEEIQGEMQREHSDTEKKETITRITRLLFFVAIMGAGVMTVVTGYGIIEVYREANQRFTFFQMLVLYLMILSAIWIIPILLLILNKVFKKKYLKKYEEQLENDDKREEEIEDIIRKHGKFLALIPEEYRYYSAVSYMVKSYKAGKVDCVKEAIVRYEENVYREFGVTDLNLFAEFMKEDAYHIDNL